MDNPYFIWPSNGKQYEVTGDIRGCRDRPALVRLPYGTLVAVESWWPDDKQRTSILSVRLAKDDETRDPNVSIFQAELFVGRE